MPFSFDPMRARRAVFAPEWRMLAVLAVIDLVWALAVGLRFENLGARLALIPAGVMLLLGLRGCNFTAAARTCEYIFLSFTGSLVMIGLSYLCLASAGPLVDGRLLAADRTLGFDWLAIRHWLDAHPPLAAVMRTLYASLTFQGFTVTLLLALRGDAGQMRELWRLSTLGCILCCLVAISMPALGPFKVFHFEAEAVFLTDLEKLVAGGNLRFPIETVTGVITFPSFHTVLALTIVYALRRHGAIFWLFAGANGLMLFTIPFYGGHYFVDVLGGIAIFAVALALVKLLEKRGSRRMTQSALAPA